MNANAEPAPEREPMTDQRLTAIERKLDGMQATLNKIAVQHEQITALQGETSALWRKWDDLTKPDGELSRIARHQASCPREQIKFLWWIIIPMGLTLVGTGLGVIVAVL